MAGPGPGCAVGSAGPERWPRCPGPAAAAAGGGSAWERPRCTHGLAEAHDSSESSRGPAEPFEEKLRPQGSCPWPLAAAAQISSVFSVHLLLSSAGSRERLVPDLSGAQVAPAASGPFLAPLQPQAFSKLERIRYFSP